MIWWLMVLAWWATFLEPLPQRPAAPVIDLARWKAEHPAAGGAGPPRGHAA